MPGIALVSVNDDNSGTNSWKNNGIYLCFPE